jgi:hypothetical protein
MRLTRRSWLGICASACASPAAALGPEYRLGTMKPYVHPLRVPDGTDWFEYMLNAKNPNLRTLGVMNHFALEVPSAREGHQTMMKRGLTPDQGPKIGRNGKWQLNLFDANLTRVELMEPAPVQKPCCSPILK